MDQIVATGRTGIKNADVPPGVRARANLLVQTVGQLFFNEPALVEFLEKAGFATVGQLYAIGVAEKLAPKNGFDMPMLELLKHELRAANLPDDFAPDFDAVVLVYKMAFPDGEAAGRMRVLNFTFTQATKLQEGQTLLDHCEISLYDAVSANGKRIGVELELNDTAVPWMNCRQLVEFRASDFAGVLKRARTFEELQRQKKHIGEEVTVETVPSLVWIGGIEYTARTVFEFTKACGSIVFDPEHPRTEPQED